VITLVEAPPRSPIDKPLRRSLTSVQENCRAACQAASPTDFIAKLGLAKKSLSGSLERLDILGESPLVERELLAELVTEGKGLAAMIDASIQAAERQRSSQSIDAFRTCRIGWLHARVGARQWGR
jgi:four helix bundle protein